jgi:hypothetical protein
MANTPQKDDISKCVKSLAREIDRLPAGHYVVTVDKPAHNADGWHAQIDRVETVREMDISIDRSGAVAPAQIIGDHSGRLQPKRGQRV